MLCNPLNGLLCPVTHNPFRKRTVDNAQQKLRTHSGVVPDPLLYFPSWPCSCKSHGMKLVTPFRCSGTSLPPQLLLGAKLLAVCLVLTGAWHNLPDPFLPFLSVFDHFTGTSIFRWVLKLVLLTAIGSLFLNRCVRLSCVAIGSVFFAGILSSKIFFENNILFVSCIFLLIGLSESPQLVRYQLALVYFGAGMNKLLDPNWRLGAFFATWSHYAIREPLYFVFAGVAPRALPALMSWATISAELTLATWLLLGKRLRGAAWLGVSFHTMTVFMTGRTFGMFYYAALASWIALLDWPHEVTVLYDSDCGFCDRTRRFFQRWDLERLQHWTPFERTEQSVHVEIGDKLYTGFAAFKAIVGSNPLTYFALAGVLSLFHSRWLGVVVLLMISPLIVPAGEIAYRWVARNRYRIPGSSGACTLPQQ
jgi:predicted DCC family thiol-disulfide oxidoreductase YuxK